MKIAITLIHNKTDVENSAQIEALKSLLVEVTDGPFTNPDTGETWTTIHHEIKNLNIPHEVKVYQVVPFGVTPPANRGDINSGGIVYYGKGDEDKTGNHPRFFNWAHKRGTDNGAEVSIYLEDVSQLTAAKVRNALTRSNDYEDREWGKLATLKLLKQVGQLKEDRAFINAITELKQRVAEKGLKHG